MRLVLVVLAALATAAPSAARPGAAVDAGQTPAAGGGPPAEAPPAPPAPPPLDFDLLGASPVTARKPTEELQREVRRRRSMLALHQGFGIAAWAALAATTLVGQLDFDDRFRGGGDTGRYHAWHRGLAAGAGALFLATGLLGILAPEPYPKPLRLDTATVHKAAMGLAAAGMAAQLILGLAARGRAGTLSERRLAEAHQVVGYATFGAMTGGVVVLLF